MRPDAGRADLLDLSSVEAALFDMDGMLVVSDASFKRAGGLVRRVWRRVSDDFVRGSPAAEDIRRIFSELGAESLTERVARFLEFECADVTKVVPMPGHSRCHRCVMTPGP